jgi:hypothetical protein
VWWNAGFREVVEEVLGAHWVIGDLLTIIFNVITAEVGDNISW